MKQIVQNLHNLFCRLVYSCPGSTPLPALCGEAGLLSMGHRVMAEKVCLVTRILHSTDESEENYAREILTEQLANAWDGLSKEVEEICSRVGLPNACTQYVHREEVMEAIATGSLSYYEKMPQ